MSKKIISKKNSIIAFMMLCFFAFTQVFAASQLSFNKIVFFGDSMSDNGNLYKITDGYVPHYLPYFKGRFSDGYVWSDRVAYDLYEKYFVRSQNYAVGGATALLHENLGEFVPYSLEMEYYDYEAHNLFSDKSNTLYSIWIGANDYLKGATDVNTATTNVVNSIVNVVQKLVKNPGAQFLIIDLPDLSLLPIARQMHLQQNYAALVKLHNEKLHAAVLKLRQEYPQTRFIEFSFTQDPLLKNMITNPQYRQQIDKKYHEDIQNVTTPCWTGDFSQVTADSVNQQLLAKKHLQNFPSYSFAQYAMKNPGIREAIAVANQYKSGGQVCADPSEHLFWDHIHPTTGVHKIIADIMLQKILGN